jgi:predicted amidophosphoribosyltransferase
VGLLVRAVTPLVELVFPGGCAGCGGSGVLTACEVCLAELRRAPVPTRPTPAPPGLPPCVTGGGYDGPRRELLLAYKERGRRGLARPLGYSLAAAVLAGFAASVRPQATVLVPVPATAAAVRERHGDHMWLLARYAARRLREAGWPVLLAAPLRARPKADSTRLDRQARASAARYAFAPRPPRLRALQAATVAGARVVLLDDVVTTGATLAAVAVTLAAYGVPVEGAATVAATRLRCGLPDRFGGPGMPS